MVVTFKTGSEEVRVAIIAPLSLLVFYLLLVVVYRASGGPPSEVLTQRAMALFAQHGYPIVLLGALLEGLLLVGWYFPGSVVIVFGVVVSKSGALNPVAVVALIIAAFYGTSLVNYALGRFGWYRLLSVFGLKAALDRMHDRVSERGLRVVFPTFFHPNVGALAATSCGVLRLPFGRFALYAIIALVAWNTLWGVLVYVMGDVALKFLNMWVVIAGLLLWAAVRLIRVYR